MAFADRGGLFGVSVRRVAVVVLGVSWFVWVAGCSSSSAPVERPVSPTAAAGSASGAPSATAVPSSASPAVGGPEVSALVAYRRYWAARVVAVSDPTKAVPEELRRSAVDTALTDVQSAVLLYRRQGIAWRGSPRLAPTVVGVSGTQPVTVSVSDCVDSSNWSPVFVASGVSARAPGQPTRVVVRSTATVYDGRWVIRTSTVFRDRSC